MANWPAVVRDSLLGASLILDLAARSAAQSAQRRRERSSPLADFAANTPLKIGKTSPTDQLRRHLTILVSDWLSPGRRYDHLELLGGGRTMDTDGLDTLPRTSAQFRDFVSLSEPRAGHGPR